MRPGDQFTLLLKSAEQQSNGGVECTVSRCQALTPSRLFSVGASFTSEVQRDDAAIKPTGAGAGTISAPPTDAGLPPDVVQELRDLRRRLGLSAA
jgi:hypothetical protein